MVDTLRRIVYHIIFITLIILFLLMAKVLITKDVEMFIPEAVSLQSESDEAEES